MYIGIGHDSRLLGVSVTTMRRWDRNRKFPADRRIKGNHRRYLFSRFQQQKGNDRMAFGYARVSGHKQTKDLEKQKQSLQNYADKNGYGGCQIFVDIASGLNDQRRNLQRLIKTVAIYQPEVVIVTYHDRLARFGPDPAVLPTFWNVSIHQKEDRPTGSC
ncbi:MAG: hypothetical protein D6732_18040 [Methanobacteriota archaeon]|nr:MAG: hypothetical protein D6732_18040 [Euryarchaeota archaeon]